MEVHRQTCQACGSRTMNNIVVRPAGRPNAIYVRCARCHALVAMYELNRYYHHGKGVESYLRSLGGHVAESGRNTLEEFRQLEDEARAQYPRVLDALEAQGKTFDR